ISFLSLTCNLHPSILAGGTQRLPRCLGVALAKELIFTGRRLNGVQAHELGLVNHAVAQNEEGNAAYHRARALAQEILPQNRGREQKVTVNSSGSFSQRCHMQLSQVETNNILLSCMTFKVSDFYFHF
uniref:Enoyl-CoA hydratase domain-containing protein 2, mitochondrial-like protein n=1 Tax=Castor canadensis TaxID=51338 RepID=A0A8C0ZU14_CASCN